MPEIPYPRRGQVSGSSASDGRFNGPDAKAADRVAAYVCDRARPPAVAKVRAPRRARKPLAISVRACRACGEDHDRVMLFGWRLARDEADLTRLVAEAWGLPDEAPPEPKPPPAPKPREPAVERGRDAILARLAGGEVVAAAELQAASGVSRNTYRALSTLEVERIGGGPAARYRLRREDAPS